MSLNKSQVTKLVVDLCWEYDRMSSSGQETLDKLCKVLGIETEAEMDQMVQCFKPFLDTLSSLGITLAFETSLVLSACKILGNNFFSEKDHA